MQHAIGQGGRYRRHIPFEGETFLKSCRAKTSEIIKRRKLFFCSSCEGGPLHFLSSKRGTVASWSKHHFTPRCGFWCGCVGFRWVDLIALIPSHNKSLSHLQSSTSLLCWFQKMFWSKDLRKWLSGVDSVISTCAVGLIVSNHPAELVWFWLLLAVFGFYSCWRFFRLAN